MTSFGAAAILLFEFRLHRCFIGITHLEPDIHQAMIMQLGDIAGADVLVMGLLKQAVDVLHGSVLFGRAEKSDLGA